MKSKSQFLKGCIRTSVLQLLSEKPMYGYQIATELAKRSEDIFSLGQGTLYPMLYSLEKKNLIKTSHTEFLDNGRKRLYYTITESGFEMLEENKLTWFEVVRAMQLVLGTNYG
ncbi:PadR family transcriptional regulator [Candidatus Uabimicrobium amorphum]|uniref:PadR family transcriptional regulator n=1 Tax=Uabimicrobium amorphum TaxID=2596890 RepID=A0A5S9IQT4_UABAM|nr:PadR family transcriptional regulator [Candidatus Uabimicrobium amorphum]BBM85470.1 PadR family transcriptional regulator [Candidatus Uabimicrobium amorphum]